VDLLDGLIRIDHMQEIVLHGMENLTAKLQGFPLFEFVAPPVADADPFKSRVEGEVEKEKQVGAGCKFLIDPADLSGIEAADPLIGHGGKVIAVENDDLATLQGRGDELFHVLTPVLVKELKFLLGREPPAGG